MKASNRTKSKFPDKSSLIKSKRRGWEKAFKAMAANGDDKLTIPDVLTEEDFTDWKW